MDKFAPRVRDALPWLQKPLCWVGAHIWNTYAVYRCCGYCNRLEVPVYIQLHGERRLLWYVKAKKP